MASIDQLWPPNHKFVSVSIEGVTGADSIVITGVQQDEPTVVNPGDQCPDATGIGEESVMLRSERRGNLDGRVYHLSFTAYGDGDEICEGVVTVCVPHDQGPEPNCVDQGPLYDSTVCE